MSDGFLNDLSWDAYRYIAGEMTDDELVRFELRLAVDDSACDAVEKAVELNEAIRLASVVSVSDRPPRTSFFARHSTAWTAASVVCAACLALAFFAWRVASMDSLPIAPEVANDPERRRESDPTMQVPISIAWAELQGRDLTERNDSATTHWTETVAMSRTEQSQRNIGDLEGVDMTVPQWLLTATAADAVNVNGAP